MNCRHCHQEICNDHVIRVDADTVTDTFEAWLACPSGSYPVRVTDKILIVCVKNGAALPEETSHGNSRQDDS